MKAVSVVGPKKSGKTALVEAMVRALAGRGRVGTVKNMPDHEIEDRGDTRRHFDAGADVVVGVGKDGVTFKVARGGGLDSALAELEDGGVDYAIIEGFKRSKLPKIVLGAIDVSNPIRNVDGRPPFDDRLIEELVGLLMSLPDLRTPGRKPEEVSPPD
ncbi:molybdopterin-guanine dinucleotide biosynthesis protein B [Methanotrichaceae archaeon M04Ac]|uniref:Molybdopterin-guanine dinucleotide biosynthesis protein B n=1 Tax=Candidatus Methanocrinis alkalitolerans TaxID=3033395 RepID=A0ABT5XGR4_9EURY|nr:molybdopterin-guanine dinucleotide biosynthesis protein B [Candidatus Methanocrinis alkalitolerans]MCR3883547.1 molybdopterin-guanine dinucleotide biosynthesis protein B [Methanothrix sp.]MDF0593910.1 molybdopterin-guanine dinucleotide biosynthesis protein B [Candidatus Methanocrinis alkalitolerans]